MKLNLNAFYDFMFDLLRMRAFQKERKKIVVETSKRTLSFLKQKQKQKKL